MNTPDTWKLMARNIEELMTLYTVDILVIR